ncbi:glycosyltransferase family 4 protein [Candidatus Collierbacteria bacterium]|nr:glycosyltransferase family 4 protein [Candidatus Collierbacteria bacterium]
MAKSAVIFDPYFDTLGGGERYILIVARVLNNLGYRVSLAWPDNTYFSSATDRFNIDLSFLKPDPVAFQLFSHPGSLIAKARFTRQFDLAFWLSDGSLPYLSAKKNFIHIQTPLKLKPFKPLNYFKILKINRFIYNSDYTRNALEPFFPSKKGVVLYPPVDTDALSQKNVKKDLILSVGRFDSPSHSKRQDILIEAFRTFKKQNPRFQLVLAGGLKGDEKSVDKLRSQAGSLPVEFLINPSFIKLKSCYLHAKFYWHAAGFEVNERHHPDRVEHFGISTVEAMAAGCIPVVIAKGGQREIITPDSGFLVDSIEDMVNSTNKLARDKDLLTSYSTAARSRAQDFSEKRFSRELENIIANA